MKRVKLLTLIAASSLIAGPVIRSAAAPSLDRASGIRSMNKVGLDLIREIIKSDSKSPEELRNTLVSPVSAFAAFSMLHSGLRGDSLKNFDTFLALDREFAENFNAQSSALLNSLQAARRTDERPGNPRRPVVSINNSAWSTNGATGHERFTFTPTFVTAIKANYQASVESLDFKQAGSATAINRWASEKTNGMIDQVISADILRDLVWLLVNATYFESNWAAKFQSLKAVAAPRFTLLDGKRVAVDMIRTQGQLNLLEYSDYQAIEIPFYESDLSFFVVMPGAPREFARWMIDGAFFNTDQWNALTTAFLRYETSPAAGETEVTLRMPKLHFGFSKQLSRNQPLTASLGLDFLFNPGNAPDFAPLGGIVGQPAGSTVGLIKQDTKIELDENGVKAAAVTQIGGVRGSARVPPRIKKDLVIDKPFVFFIGSKRSQAILFAGTVVDPTRQ